MDFLSFISIHHLAGSPGKGGRLVRPTLEYRVGFQDAEGHPALATPAWEDDRSRGKGVADCGGGLWVGASLHGAGRATSRGTSTTFELHASLWSAERDDRQIVRGGCRRTRAGLQSHSRLHEPGQVTQAL